MKSSQRSKLTQGWESGSKVNLATKTADAAIVDGRNWREP